MNKSVKKYIIWGLVLAFIVGSALTGGPFNLIDIIIVRPIVNIQFMISFQYMLVKCTFISLNV